MVKKVLMLTGDFGEDYEIMVPFQCLQVLGYEVDVVCPKKKKGETIQTAIHDFKKEFQFFVETHGHAFTLTKDFDEVKPEEYDGLYIPGGRAPEYLQYETKVIEIVQHFIKNNKPLCAVCHGPLLLAAAGGIEGKTLTSFTTVQNELKYKGVNYVCKEEAYTDGNIVTGQSYMSHVPLIQQFVKILGK